ncbi:MAG: hypothetical protein B6D55_06295 [Candidatus Omnitrophica bacterium 4484_70.2]|nr:MAG: hypothetical protein B6D55_06295 [Candidatus Omnitrophica bacterium 4484_70.2]
MKPSYRDCESLFLKEWSRYNNSKVYLESSGFGSNFDLIRATNSKTEEIVLYHIEVKRRFESVLSQIPKIVFEMLKVKLLERWKVQDIYMKYGVPYWGQNALVKSGLFMFWRFWHLERRQKNEQ